MTNKDIKNIYFNNNGISALYQGTNLIWKKIVEGTYQGNFAGKFTDNSTKTDWWYKRTDSENNTIKCYFDVDENKEFDINIESQDGDILYNNLMDSNDEIEKIYKLEIAPTTARYMFYGCSSLTSVDLSGLNTSNVTNMTGMFNSCSSLTSVNLSGLNTSNVTNMSYMFWECKLLTSLDVTGFDTSMVTNINAMFLGCSSLTSLDVTGFDTSMVTNMTGMFSSCSSLTSLDLTNFNTSRVTEMSTMFSSCSSLTSLDLTNFNTSRVTEMIQMFSGCKNLQTLIVNFDTSKIYRYTDMNYMFQNCTSLTNVIGAFNGTKYNLDLSYSPLTADSAMVFINGLSEITRTWTLKLSSTTYDSLTEEQIAVATSKGWTVTRS